MVRLKAFLYPTYPAQFALGEDLVRRRILEFLDRHTRLAIYPYEKTSLDELAAHADRLLIKVKATHASDSSEQPFFSSSQRILSEMFESHLDGIDRILSLQTASHIDLAECRIFIFTHQILQFLPKRFSTPLRFPD